MPASVTGVRFSPQSLAMGVASIILFFLVTGAVYAWIEGWDFINGLYFAIVTLSTTGYGDKAPQTAAGKFVNVIFIFMSFCGFFVILRVIISALVDWQLSALVSTIREKRLSLRQKAAEKGILMAPLSLTGDKDYDATLEVLNQARQELGSLDGDGDETVMEEDQVPGMSAETRKYFVTSMYLLAYFLWLIIWAVFYTNASKEKKEFKLFFQAIYFGVISSSTVGYGDQVPQSAGGKLFCCIFLVIGALCLAAFSGHMSEHVITFFVSVLRKRAMVDTDHQHEKTWRRAKYMLNKMLLDAYRGDAIDKCDYVTNMLVAAGRCSREEVVKLIEQFNEADKDGNGCLDLSEIARLKTSTVLKATSPRRESSRQAGAPMEVEQ